MKEQEKEATDQPTCWRILCGTPRRSSCAWTLVGVFAALGVAAAWGLGMSSTASDREPTARQLTDIGHEPYPQVYSFRGRPVVEEEALSINGLTAVGAKRGSHHDPVALCNWTVTGFSPAVTAALHVGFPGAEPYHCFDIAPGFPICTGGTTSAFTIKSHGIPIGLFTLDNATKPHTEGAIWLDILRTLKHDDKTAVITSDDAIEASRSALSIRMGDDGGALVGSSGRLALVLYDTTTGHFISSPNCTVTNTL